MVRDVCSLGSSGQNEDVILWLQATQHSHVSACTTWEQADIWSKEVESAFKTMRDELKVALIPIKRQINTARCYVEASCALEYKIIYAHLEFLTLLLLQNYYTPD